MRRTTLGGILLFDIVTVVHNDKNKSQAADLLDSIHQYMTYDCNVFIEDNSVDNLGFAKACNIGAAKGTEPVVAFINPDCVINGDFMTPIMNTFIDIDKCMITGGNFNKNPVEISGWGCKDWVCGAAMFVWRNFWIESGGFDEQFVWAYEETDLIRRCESMGYVVKSLPPSELPILHSSPAEDSKEDSEYKSYWMAESGSRFWRKWNG